MVDCAVAAVDFADHGGRLSDAAISQSHGGGGQSQIHMSDRLGESDAECWATDDK